MIQQESTSHTCLLPRRPARHLTLRRALPTSAVVLALTFAGHAFAQTAAPASGDPGPVTQSDQAPIVEIMVTARRRRERLVDVPVNVASLSANDLASSRITTPTDLSGRIPNVNVKNFAPGLLAVYTIRGVGLDDFSSTNNSSVGIYVDGVYIPSIAELDFDFLDLDRIEVLKGPQGALYGRNSTAGAINFISAKPNFDGVSGRLSASYGNYDTYEAVGVVNVPLSKTLALRVAGKTSQQDQGYYYSRVTHDTRGKHHDYIGRAELLWKPTDRLSALLKVEGENNHGNIEVAKFFGTVPVPGYTGGCPNFRQPALCTDNYGYTDTSKNPHEGDSGSETPMHEHRFSTTLTINDDFGWGRLTSISNYTDFKRNYYNDIDSGPLQQTEFDQTDGVHHFSQEARLAGSYRGIDWLIGAVYGEDKVHSPSPGQASLNLAGPPPNAFFVDSTIENLSNQRTKSGAVYGQVKVPLVRRLSVDLGLRYTSESRHYAGGTIDITPNTQPPSLCFYLGACPTNVRPANLTFLDDHIHNDDVSFRGSLNWKPDANQTLYIAVARGYKSGGFFNGFATVNAALAPYKPERLTDYEAGYNADLLDGKLRIESSVFYYDYKDVQTQVYTSVGAIALIKLGNVSKARVYGLGASVDLMPITGLTLQGGLGLLHTRLGSFETSGLDPSTGVNGPYTVGAGNKLPDAPDVTFNALARYEVPISSRLKASAQIGARYEDHVFLEALNTPYLASPSHWLVDGRLSLATLDDHWRFDLWAKNLANASYVTQATDVGIGFGNRLFNPPRTYGVTLSHAF